MADAKHTPGPWHIYRKADEAPTNLPWIAAMGNKPVAFVVHESIMNEDLARAEANARLIAAAPDLLEALKELMSVIDTTDEYAASARYDANKAIAKAEGRS